MSYGEASGETSSSQARQSAISRAVRSIVRPDDDPQAGWRRRVCRHDRQRGSILVDVDPDADKGEIDLIAQERAFNQDAAGLAGAGQVGPDHHIVGPLQPQVVGKVGHQPAMARTAAMPAIMGRNAMLAGRCGA